MRQAVARAALALAVVLILPTRIPALVAPIAPGEAASHMGELVVVEGHVDMVTCSPQACLLSFEAGFSGLVVAIRGPEVERFADLKQTFETHRVRVRGVVVERNGRPRIEIESPAAIELAEKIAASPAIPSGAPAAASSPEAEPEDSRVRVEVAPPPRPLTVESAAARLGVAAGSAPHGAEGGAGMGIGAEGELRLLRQEISALVARLTGLEERLTALDERVVGVEDALGSLPHGQGGVGGPALPAYVVPGVNPPTLHRVTSGWTAKRVLRVLGAPETVSGNAPGPFTWSYGNGRAVTIDEHGLVVATTGF